MWCLWRWRNKKLFGSVEVKLESVLDEIKARLWSWFMCRDGVGIMFSFDEWLARPR